MQAETKAEVGIAIGSGADAARESGTEKLIKFVPV